MAHPHISAPCRPLALYATQHRGQRTPTSRRESRMERWPIEAICNVDALEVGDRVRDKCGRGRSCRCYRVLPGFLHVGMHDEEGVVGKMDGNLTLDICAVGGLILALAPDDNFIFLVTVIAIVIGRNDLTNAEFTGHAEGERADCWARAEIGQLVGVVSDAVTLCQKLRIRKRADAPVQTKVVTFSAHLSAPPS